MIISVNSTIAELLVYYTDPHKHCFTVSYWWGTVKHLHAL